MKQVVHDMGLTVSILAYPIKLLMYFFVAIYKAFVIMVLLVIHYVDYVIHYKSYNNECRNQKADWERLFSDYENGLISISIDYPKD